MVKHEEKYCPHDKSTVAQKQEIIRSIFPEKPQFDGKNVEHLETTMYLDISYR